jgi:hypothetical protein
MTRAGCAALTILIALTIGGCAPMATYPPVEYGGETLTDPAFEPFPALMALAIRHAHSEHAGPDEIFINLPGGASHKAYERVIYQLGEGEPMTEADQVGYHVTEVRTRGFEGEVDLIYPTDDGTYEFATFSFKSKLVGGHYVADTRTWRIRIELPAPNYVRPAESPDSAPEGATVDADA